MADYITLDGKKYKVTDLDENSWKPAWQRQKTYSTGLTGKTIMQDFTQPVCGQIMIDPLRRWDCNYRRSGES
jgi:hypothetical protein